MNEMENGVTKMELLQIFGEVEGVVINFSFMPYFYSPGHAIVYTKLITVF